MADFRPKESEPVPDFVTNCADAAGCRCQSARMELSKVVALAAVFFMIVLVLTAGTGVA
jgi:hypothetical protein